VAATSEPVRANFQDAWGKRLQSLKNIPPVLRIIWDSSPAVVGAALVLAAVAFGASGAIAVLTRFFCTVSVSVFAIASTFGLVARMRV
jgi:ATP-binding cassette, subfamily B, bacterial